MKLIQYLPSRLAEIKEIADFQEALQPIIDNYDIKLNQVLDNKNPKRANLEGILRWEEWLKINPPPNSSIDERRKAIIAQLNERLPYSDVQLRRMLAGIVGWDHFSIVQEPGEQTLLIDVDLMTEQVDAVYKLLLEIIPAHVLWKIREYFESESEAESSVGAFVFFGTELTMAPYVPTDIDTEASQAGAAMSHVSFGTTITILPEEE